MSIKRLPAILTVSVVLANFLVLASVTGALEVAKGGIPAEHLAKSFKTLPWGVTVWDTEEAIACLNNQDRVLWIDTRPESFYKQGSVRNAVVLRYDKSGSAENVLTRETLEAALKAAGLEKANAKVVFFCQGPECHRSYNAAFAAVEWWGFKTENVIWFRAGYPLLIQEIQENAKLKRKAATYVSDEAVSTL
jgi:rhodanese-related sulfurtransferase